eukprot:scaffold13751_cov108-Isochrysis_galbana.AAC.11
MAAAGTRTRGAHDYASHNIYGMPPTHSLVSVQEQGGGDKGVPLEVPPHNTLNTSHSSQVGGWAHKTLKTNAEHSDTGRSGLLSGARRYGTISDHTKKTCK